MTKVFKKTYVAMAGILMAISTHLNGANYDPSTCCEPSCCNSKAGEWNVWGELLYLRPELCGLERAFGNTAIATTVADGALTTTVTESDQAPHSQWNPGFRVGADIACDYFDVEVDWLHFDGRATFKEGVQHGHWNIQYDVIDLLIGRRFCVAPCFSFKPFIGLRGAMINQSLRSHLTTTFTSVIASSSVVTDIHNTEDFRGLAPELGIEVDIDLGCNFSLYGNFDIVTYYGEIKSTSFETDNFTTTISVGHGKIKRCFNSIGTDGELGICWDTMYTCGCYDVNFMLKLGVEQHRIYDFSNLGADGTLSLDGGVFGVGLGFNF